MRNKLVKGLIFGTALSLWSFSLWQIVGAQSSSQNLVVAPFVAADRKETKDFVADVVSTAKRSPFLLRTNNASAAMGTYNGVVITPDATSSAIALNNLTMDVKGGTNAAAVVHYNLPPSIVRGSSHLGTSSVNLNSASKLGMTKDGYQKLSFNTTQLGIPQNSLIQKIVIAQQPGVKSGNFLVDNVNVNMAPVKKAMDTLFFSVKDGSPTGPAGNVSSPQGKLNATNPTGLTVKNATGSPVTVWATLPTVCTPNSQCLLSVQDIFPQLTCVQGGCFQGSTTLGPNATLTYNPSGTPPSIQGLLISFAAAPNCQVTVAEATINNISQSVNNFTASETVDISIVNGNNASIQMGMTNNGATWTTNFGTQNYKGAFQNFAGANLNIPGVYPFLCTNCTSSQGPPPCGTLTAGCNTPCTGNADPVNCPQVCSFQRPSNQNGGTVSIVYLGAPQPMPTTNAKLKRIYLN